MYILIQVPIRFKERRNVFSGPITQPGFDNYGVIFSTSSFPTPSDFDGEALVGARLVLDLDTPENFFTILGGYFLEQDENGPKTVKVFGIAKESRKGFNMVEEGTTLLVDHWTLREEPEDDPDGTGINERNTGDKGWTFIVAESIALEEYPDNSTLNILVAPNSTLVLNERKQYNDILRMMSVRPGNLSFSNDSEANVLRLSSNEKLFAASTNTNAAAKSSANLLTDLPLDVKALDNWILQLRSPFSIDALNDQLLKLFGHALAELIKTDLFQGSKTILIDRLKSKLKLQRRNVLNLDQIIRQLKVIAFLERLENDHDFVTIPNLDLYLQSVVLLLPPELDLKQPDPVDKIKRSTLLPTSPPSSADPEAPSDRAIIYFNGSIFKVKELKQTFLRHMTEETEEEDDPALQGCSVEVGIGDLLVIGQKLRGYELGEIAHIENVLKGETRERTHRRLNQREEILIEESEVEAETERNLETTERNETQEEARSILQEDRQFDAGLSISGSYGPSVSFNSSLNTSRNTTTEEAKARVATFSREVTERTSERLRERTRTERRRRILEEIEVTNFNSFNNSDPGNESVRGIYRWVNKIYDAQVFNYGQRMMIEFVVPEPAFFFLHSLINDPPPNVLLEEPQKPSKIDLNGIRRPLSPKDITPDEYQKFVAEYQVVGVPGPYEASKTYSDSQNVSEDKEINNRRNKILTHSGVIEIDDGYEVEFAEVGILWGAIDESDDLRQFAKFSIGGQLAPISDFTDGRFVIPLDQADRISESISYAFNLHEGVAFSLSVQVRCKLKDEKFKEWQQAVYDLIIENYNRQKTAFEDKLAALAFVEPASSERRNPIENRQLERTELKKLAIMLLKETPKIGFSSVSESFFGSLPELDIEKTVEAGPEIRFLENAFEWNNMTYIFYPYFWGRESKWGQRDPDF